ncbi:ATP-binding protein [Vibrio alfacsensis]|uniref:ATP-binding protein n=1 Tax=Vibrio alfacsensis TaxID=1074311 RepID=UPI002ADD4956|nr:ATP-binding protein [Vibrio alfacsensis]WQE75389.1 ATP-binding protein [Vibrio alfacsensis]
MTRTSWFYDVGHTQNEIHIPDELTHISKQLGVTFTYKVFPTDESLLKALENKEIDLGLGTELGQYSKTSFLLSEPLAQQQIYVWYHHSNLHNATPYTLQWGCIAHSASCEENDNMTANAVMVFESQNALIDALSKNKVNAALVSVETINKYYQTIGVGEWFGDAQYLSNIDATFIATKSNEQIIESINVASRALKSSKTEGLSRYTNHLFYTLAIRTIYEQLKTDTIRYSIEGSLAPYSYLDVDSNKITGYFHELMAIYSKKSGLKFEYIEQNGKSLEAMLRDGEIDIYPAAVMGEISNHDHFYSTDAIFSNKWIKVKSDIWSPKTDQIGVLDKTNRIFNPKNNSLVDQQEYIIYNDLNTIEDALENGDIAYAYLPETIAHYYMYYSNDKVFQLAGNPEDNVIKSEVILLTTKTSPLLVNALNLAIKKTSTHERDLAIQKLQKIQAHYGYDKNFIKKISTVVILTLIVSAFFVRKKISVISSDANEKEQQLKHSSEQLVLLNAVIEQFPGMIAIVDQNNDTIIANSEFKRCFDGCVKNKCTLNPSCCRLLESLEPTQFGKTHHEFAIEKSICPIDGKFYQVYQERVFTPLTKIEYRVLIYTDCTTHQIQRKELAESRAEAIKALHAREAFLAMISHELRTPLAAIMGLLELLSPEIKKLENRELFSSAQQSAKRLNLLVNDILDFSKIEAGQTLLDTENGNIFDELSPQLRTFEAMAKNNNIDFIVNWSSTHLAIASLDWARLNQIVSNIINNAIKFTQVGSVVVTIQQTSSTLQITVRDSGCGMTKEQLSQIYQPFVQADRSISRKFGGSGLGMSIVKKLMDLMNGTITINSEPDIGTSIELLLPVDFKPLSLCKTKSVYTNNGRLMNWLLSWNVPVALAPGANTIRLKHNFSSIYPDLLLKQICETEEENDSPYPTHLSYSGFVLVADDDQINRLLFTKQLNRLGVAHHCVSDGKEAYDYLVSHVEHIDMVITDCHMPIMNGYQLAEKIRQNPNTQNIPVIGCTAEDSRLVTDKALNAGMTSIIYKPYTMAILEKTITAYSGALMPSQTTPLKHWLTQYGIEEQREIAETLVESLNEELANLNNPNVAHSEIGHKIKGMASLLGLDELADAAKHCQLADADSVALALQALEETIKTTLQDVSLWLENNKNRHLTKVGS